MPRGVVAAELKIRRMASSGGVLAKKASVLYVATSLATQRDRMSGLSRSPLLVSTQRPLYGVRPVLFQACRMGAVSNAFCGLDL